MPKRLVLMVFLVCLHAQWAWSAAERRSEALQLYQEGLFQETGTGDLILAKKIYQSIVDNYPDYRDIAAVAAYHVGLICEKLGQTAEAQTWFNHITTRYVEQERVIRQAAAKLKTTQSAWVQQAGVPPEATPSPSAPLVAAHTATQTARAPLAAPGLSTSTATAAVAPATTTVRTAVHKKPKRPRPQATWGVGVDYEGLHLRQFLSVDFMFEASYRTIDNHGAIGLRGIFFFTAVEKKRRWRPYAGVEGNLLYDHQGWAGYRSGVLTGLEFMPMAQLGLHSDVGLYFRHLPFTLNPSRIDGGLAVGATYYF